MISPVSHHTSPEVGRPDKRVALPEDQLNTRRREGIRCTHPLSQDGYDPIPRLWTIRNLRLGSDMRSLLLKETCRTIPFAEPRAFEDSIHAKVTRRIVVDLND